MKLIHWLKLQTIKILRDKLRGIRLGWTELFFKKWHIMAFWSDSQFLTNFIDKLKLYYQSIWLTLSDEHVLLMKILWVIEMTHVQRWVIENTISSCMSKKKIKKTKMTVSMCWFHFWKNFNQFPSLPEERREKLI